MQGDYIGRNLYASGKLHGAVLPDYAACRKLLYMADHRFYFREWRKFRHLTQEQVVNRLASLDDPMLPQTEASLSRIETGKQPYSQRILEALADIYTVEPHQLIGHNPNKEGELIDLLAILDEKQTAQARAVIQALGAA